MAASAPKFTLPTQGSAPYPGIRPFEATESDWFFGRDRDADLLCDKILSGRLTVLYAQSGLGKSSLLRAKVIPQIETLHSRVIYFDSWAQEDPLGALKDSLVKMAAGLGITDAGRGSPTLTELARILCSRDDRGLVLVLDQFEEFLVRHGESLDPVRSELAALLRTAKLDAAVVLSLREEFLAALEPLRQQILNLFQSTYRLENLDEDGLRHAISRPAELFGGACEPELTERLLVDLRGRSAAGAVPGLGHLVELPMLQLVCQQLWEHTEGRRLTRALYEQMGGAQRILDEHVRSLMPKRWRDQSFTARLLVHLAPASGLKMSFAAGDLVAITGLEFSAVRRELDRLAAARILRTRVYRTVEHYELQHDAFIPVLQTWRHRVIEHERRLQWVRRLLLSAVCVGLVTATLSWFFHYQHEAASRLDAMEQRRQAAEIGRQAAEQKSADDQTRYQLEKNLRDGKERELKQVEEARQHAEEAGRREVLARQNTERLLRENTALKDKLEHWQTAEIVTEMRNLPAADRVRFAPSRFDLVTYYVLYRVQDPGRMEQLRDLLEKNADLIPEDYGVLTTKPPDLSVRSSWPLTLEYPTSRRLDASGFDAEWGKVRSDTVSNWVIPLPAHVKLVPRANLRGDQVRLVGFGGPSGALELTIPSSPRYLIADTLASLKPSPERDFIEKFNKEWQHFSPPLGVAYWLVPGWSLPVWKLAGETARTPGGVVAYTALLALADKPEPLFSPEAAETLLEHAAKTYPNTVAEARAAAAGGNLANELAARVRSLTGIQGISALEALMALPQILDNLGQHVRANPISLEERGSNSGPSATPTRDSNLSGPWPRQQAVQGTQSVFGGSAEQRYKAYGDLASMYPALGSPISVQMSDDLIGEYFPGNSMTKPLSDGLVALNNEIRAEYGLNPPGFRFLRTDANHRLPLNTIHVDVRSDGPPPPTNGNRILSGPDKLKSLLGELRDLLVSTRVMWVTAETANTALTRMAPKTREWIEKKYSLTNVKELMRAALKSAPDVSVRYPVWLMSSLPFWVLVDDPTDGTTIGAHLAEEQRARQKLRVEPESTLRRYLERGADALVRDDPGAADGEFRAALQLNAKAASEAFPAIWARRTADVWMSEFRRQHGNLDWVTMDPAERLDLADLSESAKEQGNSRAVWQFALYRFTTVLKQDPGRAATLSELLKQAPAPDEIPADDARWLALQFFGQYNPLRVTKNDDQSLAEATALLKSAEQRLEPAVALRAFTDVASFALNSSTPNWGWPLLEELATLRPDKPGQSLTLELAWRLCNQERPDRLLRALSLIDGFEKLVSTSNLPAAELAAQTENISYVRALARFGLARSGEGRYESPEPLLKKLLESKNSGIQQTAHLYLMEFLTFSRRLAEAEEFGRQMIAKWPGNVDMRGAQLGNSLLKTDPAGVRTIADLVNMELGKAGPAREDVNWQYLASLSALLAKRPAWQSTVEGFFKLKKEHVNADYIRMMASAYEDPSSTRFTAALQERWARVEPATWPNRFRNGDASAWREMLIGSFLGKNESTGLIAKVTDQTKWATSDLARLPASRRGQECEAWFYEAMRARAHGERDRMLESLRRCEQTGVTGYWEYEMAVFLLAHPE